MPVLFVQFNKMLYTDGKGVWKWLNVEKKKTEVLGKAVKMSLCFLWDVQTINTQDRQAFGQL